MIVRLSALILMLLISSSALAAVPYYSLSAGAFFPGKTSTVDNSLRPVSVSYDAGWGVVGTIGAALDSGLRVENEVSYRQALAKGSSEDMFVLLWTVNIWYDFFRQSAVSPYAGGGFGYGRGSVASPGLVDNSGSGVAWQAGGGISWRIDPKLLVDVGYRYFGIEDTSSGSGVGAFNPTGSSVMAGLRVGF